MKNDNDDDSLSGLKNIGPTIQKRLQEIGIHTKNDLKRVGPVLAYQKIQSKNQEKNHSSLLLSLFSTGST